VVRVGGENELFWIWDKSLKLENIIPFVAQSHGTPE
jgi:hypothetical protein